MARLPLTVYLPRAELARLEARARAVGLARSALAGNAIKALLDGKEVGDTALAEQLRFLRCATEVPIVAHPQSEAKGDNSFWTKVGAAWPHRDGKGLSLILSVIPMNGQIVLRQPLPQP